MIYSDKVLGKPLTQFTDTLSGIQAIPSPTEGMMAFASDTNKMMQYNGSSWAEIGGGTTGTISGTIEIGVDGDGASPLAGIIAYFTVPRDMTITSWTVLADSTGSIIVDLWKDSYANFPPTVLDTITGTDKPRLSSQVKNTSSSLTGWDTSWTEGEIVAAYLESAQILTKATIILTYTGV